MTISAAPRDLIKIREAADRYQITARTLQRWVYQGRLPAYRIAHGHWRVSAADLDAFMSSGRYYLPDRCGCCGRDW